MNENSFSKTQDRLYIFSYFQNEFKWVFSTLEEINISGIKFTLAGVHVGRFMRQNRSEYNFYIV